MSIYTTQATAALEDRVRLVNELRAVHDDKAFTDADKAERIAKIEAAISVKEDEARTAVERGEREAEMTALSTRAGALTVPAQRKAPAGQDAALASMRAILAGESREALLDMAAGEAELRAALSGVPGNAGYAHPTVTFVGEVVKYMRERSNILNLARTLNTSHGEPIEIPRRITVPVSAGPWAENTAITKTDLGLDRLTFGAYKFGVIAEGTTELFEDEQIGFASLLAQDIGEVTADRVSTYMMNGTGTSQPTGLLTACVAGPNAANAAGITFDTLISLYHSVAVPYRNNGTLFTSDSLVASLRKLKDTTNQYLWQPSLFPGKPDMVLGMPVVTDPNFTTSGAGAKVAVYGDLSKYVVRQVRNLTVVRSDEYGFDRDVIAWKVTWRGDGNLLDPNAVRALTVTA